MRQQPPAISPIVSQDTVRERVTSRRLDFRRKAVRKARRVRIEQIL